MGLPRNQRFSGLSGSRWLPPWSVSAQLRHGRQGRDADRENSLPPRLPPRVVPVTIRDRELVEVVLVVRVRLGAGARCVIVERSLPARLPTP
jgi:hypothetical protein